MKSCSTSIINRRTSNHQPKDHLQWNDSEWLYGERGEWYRRHEKVNFRRGGAWKRFGCFYKEAQKGPKDHINIRSSHSGSKDL